MKNIIVALVLAASVMPALQARTLSPAEALERAFNTQVAFRKAPASAPMKLKYTQMQADDATPAVYVFSPGDGGYLVVSADEAAVPVLGYSDSGAFDAADMPPAMEWWLGEYAAEIQGCRFAASATEANRPQRTEIVPITTTRWDQGSPYNDRCPQMGASRAVTGCVATAMAQVMKYHRYPAIGTGSNSYILDYNGSRVSCDFSSTIFCWGDMTDTYTAASTAAQKSAVADLMYACGVATGMQYTPYESGASSSSVAIALWKYFGYDPAVVCLDREYYTAADWESLIYEQLRDYGPVQYSGGSGSGGHSFVCDGYSTDGYFHINWGWGGMSDGYFLLSALNPGQQGTGGSASGYNSRQDIVANVSKPRAGSTNTLYIVCPEGFGIKETSTATGAMVTFTGPIYNSGSQDVKGYLGLEMTNTATGASYTAVHPNELPMATGAGYSSYQLFLPATMASGTYSVTPVFRTAEGVTAAAKVAVSYPQSLRMTVSGTKVTFASETGAALNCSDLALTTPLYLDSDFRLTAAIRNSGTTEFYGDLCAALVAGGEIVALGENTGAVIAAGGTYSFDYTGPLSLYAAGVKPSPGNYTMHLARRDGKEYTVLSGGITVTLNAATSASLSVDDFSIEGNSAAVDPLAVNLSATIGCTRGYFGGPITAIIFDSATGMGIAQSDQSLMLSAGESATLKYTMTIPSPETGREYLAGLYRGNTRISASYLRFTAASAGIGATLVPDTAPYTSGGILYLGAPAAADGAVYTLTGSVAARIARGDSSVDLTGLPAGIYIVAAGGKSWKIVL